MSYTDPFSPMDYFPYPSKTTQPMMETPGIRPSILSVGIHIPFTYEQLFVIIIITFLTSICAQIVMRIFENSIRKN